MRDSLIGNQSNSVSRTSSQNVFNFEFAHNIPPRTFNAFIIFSAHGSKHNFIDFGNVGRYVISLLILNPALTIGHNGNGYAVIVSGTYDIFTEIFGTDALFIISQNYGIQTVIKKILDITFQRPVFFFGLGGIVLKIHSEHLLMTADNSNLSGCG